MNRFKRVSLNLGWGGEGGAGLGGLRSEAAEWRHHGGVQRGVGAAVSLRPLGQSRFQGAV